MKQRSLSLFAALVLCAHALLPFAAVYQPARAEVAAFGEKLLLCTATGLRMVGLEDLPGGQNHKTPQCPLCYIAAPGTAAAPPSFHLLAPPSFALSHAPSFQATRIAAAEEAWRKRRTRAPPLSFA